MNLRIENEKLVRKIAQTAIDYAECPGDKHWEVCSQICAEFKLDDGDGRFPIWLSRMVEGVIRDVESGEFDPRNV